MDRINKIAFGLVAAAAVYQYAHFRSLVSKHNKLCDIVGEAADREFQREIDIRFCNIVDNYDEWS